MSRFLNSCSILFLLTLSLQVALLLGAEATVAPPWIGKRVAEWSDTDAQQVLTNSPWARRTVPTLLGALTAFERRDGGNIGAQGGGQGMQLERLKDVNVFGTQGADPHPSQSRPKTLADKMSVRWESALPIRAAEFKSDQSGVPDISGEDYAVAIYDVSLKLASIDPKDWKDLPGELRKLAALKIAGRKDLRPSQVIVIGMGDGIATVVYLFPRSARITAADPRVEFDAQIGRLAIAQYFFPPEMQFQGKLEL